MGGIVEPWHFRHKTQDNDVFCDSITIYCCDFLRKKAPVGITTGAFVIPFVFFCVGADRVVRA